MTGELTGTLVVDTIYAIKNYNINVESKNAFGADNILV